MTHVLLDSNTYTLIAKGKRDIVQVIDEASRVYFSIIVIGELLAAFRGGTLEIKNKKRLDQFLNNPTVQLLSVHKETAEIYGDIKYRLRKQGTPIPSNDVWIAAHAVETGSVLVTYDRHFLKIPGLRLWDELTMRD